jgi:NAD+ kinase
MQFERKKLAIVTKPGSKEAVEIARKIINALKGKVDFTLDPKTALVLGGKAKPVGKMNVDLIVIIGGDGTVLRTLQKLIKPVPVIGVNLGEVGFLADLHPDDAIAGISSLLHDFEVEERTRLAVSINEKPLPPAANEVVIITARPAKISHFKIAVDNRKLDEFRADGVVIATPTGSTAYAMSAGGPIVDPKVDAFIIVPLAPFKLSARPWVVPAKSEIIVELLRPDKESVVVVDGQFKKIVRMHDKIKFTKSSSPAFFVKTSKDFYSKVRDKLVV